ncbi:MAG TPA: glycosyltransferase family 39 protein [Bryobacteraceae bacterium]|nr:glycosyltransferase family 39 protein [Bryobacteraceae bacterium]
MSSSSHPRFVRRAPEFGGCFLFCLALSWRSGIFQTEFGRYQDEGMHYLTGLFVQDFTASGHWSRPMQYAQQYYLHLPKIALGQWPPGFSLMQAAWGFVFGVSRVSMMWGMIVLTAWLAYLVYRAATEYFGPWLGAVAALLLIAAPLTQEQTAMVMAEIPLAATSFLAVAALARYLDSARRRDAVAFALWTFAAVMIKGNAWVVPLSAPLILLATRKLRLLRDASLWISVALIGILCVPYTLVTMHIVSQGWDTRSFPGWAYEWLSLGIHLGFVAHTVGWPLAALALCGALLSLRRREPFWTAMAIYAAVIVLFHVGVPSSIEPRKIYQIMPVMCLFAVAGADAMARMLPDFRYARPAMSAAVLLLFFFTGFTLIPLYAPGLGPAVEALISRADSRGTAVLISSSPQWADDEAALIAEWAERTRNDGTYLIRGNKLLSHNIAAPVGQPEFERNFTTGDEVRKALADIPVAFVILHTTAAKISYPHHAQLKAALDGDPDEWQRIYHSVRTLEGLGQTHTIEIYRYRKDVTGVPVHYSVDLTRKIGSSVSTGP